MINALAYTNTLQKAGFTREQAEASVNILNDVIDQNLATKEDVKDLGRKLNNVSIDLRYLIEKTESKMIIKLGGMITVAVAVIVGLSKIL